jgi:hypothetical protein
MDSELTMLDLIERIEAQSGSRRQYRFRTNGDLCTGAFTLLSTLSHWDRRFIASRNTSALLLLTADQQCCNMHDGDAQGWVVQVGGCNHHLARKPTRQPAPLKYLHPLCCVKSLRTFWELLRGQALAVLGTMQHQEAQCALGVG